jgi:hypothetical protein
MRRKTVRLFLTIVICFISLGCEEDRQALTQFPTYKTKAAGDVDVEKEFTIRIEGDAGLEVDMLLITKPTANSIERENVTVTVPFNKDFRAVNCVVWIDNEYRGREGQYRVILSQDGQTRGELEMGIKKGNKHSGRLGIL